MIFDWYQATVAQPHDVIQDVIIDQGLAHRAEVLNRGGSGYRGSTKFFTRDGDSHLMVFYGSSTAPPSIRASGEAAEPMANFLRKTWPHKVSRLDIAQDFSEPGGFKKACRLLRKIAKDHNVTSGYRIMPTDPEKGMTQYVGSHQSASMVRCYQKSHEQLAKGKIKPGELDPHAFRVELQSRPNKAEEKLLLSTLDMKSVIGWTPWTREAFTKLLKLDFPEVDRLAHQASDLDQAFSHMLFQNQRMFRRMAQRDNDVLFGGFARSIEEQAALAGQRLTESLIEIWEHEQEAAEDRESSKAFKVTMARRKGLGGVIPKPVPEDF